MPSISLAGESRLQNDGRIALYNFHEGEYGEVVYREGRTYRPEGLREIARLLRSRGDGATHPIDVRLIELLDHLQDHFGAETVEIISGYRSPGYNASLRENGRGAARESLHMRGEAADIHLDEVDEERLFEYLKALGVGGAGIYPRYLFVHADVGPPRAWREAPATSRVLIGTENNPNPAWSAVTDRNAYRPGDDATVTITNNDYSAARLATNVWYERFRKGQWAEHEPIEKGGRTTKLAPGATTTYMWKIPPGQPPGRYRLVFFTSKDLSLPPTCSNEFYVRK